jgi:hypothetical protein
MGSSTPEVPKPISYAEMMKDTINAQLELAPRILGAERRYQNAYTRLNIAQLGQAMRGMQGLYEKALPRAIEYQDKLSEADIAQQQKYLPQFVQQYREGAGSANLLSQLQAQAEEGLAAGSSLTPEQQRIAQQQARAAYAARGMGTGNRAIGAEIMNQYGMGEALQRQRQQFAGNVAGQLEQSGVPQYYNTVYQPISQSLTGLTGQASGLMSGRQFQPESQMASDIYSQNAQNKFTADAAGKANQSAMIGAGAGVAVAGAVLI